MDSSSLRCVQRDPADLLLEMDGHQLPSRPQQGQEWKKMNGWHSSNFVWTVPVLVQSRSGPLWMAQHKNRSSSTENKWNQLFIPEPEERSVPPPGLRLPNITKTQTTSSLHQAAVNRLKTRVRTVPACWLWPELWYTEEVPGGSPKSDLVLVLICHLQNR